MPRHLTNRQAETSIAAIQTTKLVKLLQDCAMGEVQLSPERIQCARILIAKTLPDQKAVEHSGAVQVEWRLQLK